MALYPDGPWARQTPWSRSRCSAGGSSAACSGSRASRSASTSASSTRHPTRRRARSGTLVTGALDDEAALAETARGADVVTYEWEGVPAAAARFLAGRVPVRPGDASLEVSQDRLVEKERFRAVGIPTAEFAGVDSRDELAARDRADRAAGGAEDASRRLRREGAGGHPGRRRRRHRLVRARRRAAHPRSARPVRTRAVDHRGARPRRRGGVLAGGRERARARHPPRHPRAALRVSTTGCRRAPSSSPTGCSTSSTTSACSRSSCSTSTASCWRTSSHRACTTRVTGPSRAPTPASSRTTCARCSAGRSARPPRGRQRDAQLHRHHARPRRGARGPGRAPARLRQGAARRTQARPRHRGRRRRDTRRAHRSRPQRRSPDVQIAATSHLRRRAAQRASCSPGASVREPGIRLAASDDVRPVRRRPTRAARRSPLW